MMLQSPRSGSLFQPKATPWVSNGTKISLTVKGQVEYQCSIVIKVNEVE